MSITLKSLASNKNELLESWMEFQLQDNSLREDLITNKDLSVQSEELLAGLLNVLETDRDPDFDNEKLDRVREILTSISVTRAQKGFSARETGFFVLTLKEAFFKTLKTVYGNDTLGFHEHLLIVNRLIDQMSLFTFDTYLRGREEVILRQRDEITEISTPVIRVWEEILVLPIIGTLDSSRTQVIMESLLTEIVNTGSSIAILDISGVPAVDSLVAQHLIKTVSAARLMGAECIISGIRPEIAQTIVHLGINLADIETKSTLASALKHSFRLQKLTLIKSENRNR